MTRRNRSHRSLDRWRGTVRRLVLGLGSVIGLALVGSFFFTDMGVGRYLAMREQAGQLERDIRDLEAANAGLRTEIGRVQHDPARLEELARDRLGFVRPNEMVYQVVPDRGAAK